MLPTEGELVGPVAVLSVVSVPPEALRVKRERKPMLGLGASEVESEGEEGRTVADSRRDEAFELCELLSIEVEWAELVEPPAEAASAFFLLLRTHLISAVQKEQVNERSHSREAWPTY